MLALLVLVAAAAWWWLGTRRAETPAPPASVLDARALSNPPGVPRARAGAEEISPDDREALERILRERAKPPAGSGD